MGSDDVEKFEAPEAEQKYKAVIIAGPRTDIAGSMRNLCGHRYGEGNYCIVGDGVNPISKEQLRSQLAGKIDTNTFFILSTHGLAVSRVDKDGNQIDKHHEIEIYDKVMPTKSGEFFADLVKECIEAGADLNKRHSVLGSTPLDFAARLSQASGDNSILRILLENGANPNPVVVPGLNMPSPIEVAVAGGKVEDVKLLMSFGAKKPEIVQTAKNVDTIGQIEKVVNAFDEVESTVERHLRKGTGDRGAERTNARQKKIEGLSEEGEKALEGIVEGLANTALHSKPQHCKEAVAGVMGNLSGKERKVVGVAMGMEVWKDKMDEKLNGLEGIRKDEVREIVKACGHMKKSNFDHKITSPSGIGACERGGSSGRGG